MAITYFNGKAITPDITSYASHRTQRTGEKPFTFLFHYHHQNFSYKKPHPPTGSCCLRVARTLPSARSSAPAVDVVCPAENENDWGNETEEDEKVPESWCHHLPCAFCTDAEEHPDSLHPIGTEKDRGPRGL